LTLGGGVVAMGEVEQAGGRRPSPQLTYQQAVMSRAKYRVVEQNYPQVFGRELLEHR